jgi:hypothetical protein
LGIPFEEVSCVELYVAGSNGMIEPSECDTIIGNVDVVSICNCSSTTNGALEYYPLHFSNQRVLDGSIGVGKPNILTICQNIGKKKRFQSSTNFGIFGFK